MTSESPIVTVHFDVHLTSDNSLRCTRSPFKRGRLVKKGREAGYLAWLEAGKPHFPPNARFNVLVRRGRVIDKQAVVGGLKPVIDGIYTDGLNVDDSLVMIGDIQIVSGKDWKGREQVELRLDKALRAEGVIK